MNRNDFPLFLPNSAGDDGGLDKLTTLAANQTFPLLEDLINTVGKGKLVNEIDVSKFCQNETRKKVSEELDVLFRKHGSDKSTTHNYHLIYGHVLANRNIESLLEIGLGSNDTNIVSNMGRGGKPGASVLAFKELMPEAEIIGADIDKSISVPGIEVFYVDQTDSNSFEKLAKEGRNSYDVIIDDGLHSPNANLAVLNFGLRRLTPEGVIIIEDIRKEAVPVWRVVAEIISPQYISALVKTSRSYVFICGPVTSNYLIPN